jgi:hypothetical protein
MTAVLTVRCPFCGGRVVVRSGTLPRLTTIEWTLRCRACERENTYPVGTLLEPIETRDPE